jgi:hypothetical protein
MIHRVLWSRLGLMALTRSVTQDNEVVVTEELETDKKTDALISPNASSASKGADLLSSFEPVTSLEIHEHTPHKVQWLSNLCMESPPFAYLSWYFPILSNMCILTGNDPFSISDIHLLAMEKSHVHFCTIKFRSGMPLLSLGLR